MTAFTVVHTPYGQEHPYEQLPEERTPRRPLAGDAFTVGIATRPAQTAQRVVVHAELEGAALPSVEAVRISGWQPEFEEGVGAEYLERIVRIEQDVWHAPLTAPPVGQTLTYWVEADGVTTERYTLVGEAWTAGGGLISAADGSIIISGDADGLNAPNLPGVVSVEWLTDGQTARRVRLTVNCAPDVGFYGLGERFNALNQRGNVMDVRCYEQYKNHGQKTYMPIPFLLTWSADNGGFGLYVDSLRWMQFDLAASQPDQWTLEADLGADGALRLVPFHGSDPFEVVGAFAQATGPVALPPEWSFGLWMSGNEWNSQARVMHEVEQSLAHGIQPSVLVIEAWSDETTFYIWNDAQYTPQPGSHRPRYTDFTFPPDGKWTDPKGMVDALHAQGVKVLLWQIPVLKLAPEPHPQHDADSAHYRESGFGVREADGSLHAVRPFWFRGGAIWDVTNPAEREWWLGKRAYLLEDIGIDGFKTDGGEHLWGESVVFHDGRRGDELWNAYPQLYAQAYYDFARQRRPDAITFSRAGAAGSQRSPLHWAGDENSTWDAFRHSVLAGLSAGVSGIAFWGWDFGGFSGEIPTAELYLRAAAMATFCPVMQYHSEYNAHRQPSNDRTPWNIQARTGDERVLPTFKSLLAVRERLMPYLWREAQHSATTGQPMMRAAQITHPAAAPYDYFFGRSLFVSPVVEPGADSWPVALPPGEWRDFWTGERFTGGQTVTVSTPIDRIPVFVRDGADVG